MRVAESRTLPVGLHEGFAYITDPANWHEFWPGFVRFARSGRWREPGDSLVLVVRILGRERELELRLERFEPDALVTYTSSQSGMPDAHHERRFAADGERMRYTLGVEYEPRRGVRGLADRLLLARAVQRALRSTMVELDRLFRQRQ